MSQYKKGTATTTNGSATVTGTDTQWASNVQAGDGFTLTSTGVAYDVAQVVSDTELTLSAPYAGDSESEGTYTVWRDFTAPDGIPEMSQGDIETATLFTRAMRKIQDKFSDPNPYPQYAKTTDSIEWSADTVSQPEAESGTATTRRAWTSQRVLQAIKAVTSKLTKADVGLDKVLNVASYSKTQSDNNFESSGAVAAHEAEADPHSQYAELAGGASANFTAMPQVGGDPVVESGSNADGEWTRWADGTQSCRVYDQTSSSILPNIDGAPGTFSWQYPLGFITADQSIIGTAVQAISGGLRVVTLAGDSPDLFSATGTRHKAELLTDGSTNISEIDGFVSLEAIGRWK